MSHFEAGRIVGQRFTIKRLVSRGVLSALYEAITAPNREILIEIFAPVAPGSSADVSARLARVVEEVNALPASVAIRSWAARLADLIAQIRAM